ncbi:hypothetical protein DL769_004884 [Monosporascus sp. CRB-8-3]|nr:hypothetical protein DL769_004884 [Monosporascus sp. CRB-8-3]
MIDQDSGEDSRTRSSASGALRRQGPSSQGQPRAKRAKYTTMACNECKKRKMRCNRNPGERDCQRCVTTGMGCTYAHTPPQELPPPTEALDSQGTELSKDFAKKHEDEIAMLRRQVVTLTSSLKDLSAMVNRSVSSPADYRDRHAYSAAVSSRSVPEPKEPLFVGHTRSAFSLGVAKSSLTEIGISTDAAVPTSADSSLSSTPRELTPESGGPRQAASLQPATDPLLSLPVNEVMRLIDVF